MSLRDALRRCKMGLGAENEGRDDRVAQISQATVHGYFNPKPAHHIDTMLNANCQSIYSVFLLVTF